MIAKILKLSFYLCLNISLVCSIQAKENSHDDFDIQRLAFNGDEIEVFTFRPPGCQKLSIFFVFHGMKRNAEGAGKNAVNFAKDACMMIFAPHFDKQRFPNWRYQRAGSVRKGKVQDRTLWSGPILDELIALARREVQSKDTKVYLFGHSAGAQFLSRISAYTPPSGVSRIVIANPSVHVAPSLSEEAPYGFGGGIFSEFEAHAALKAYLALPISIYLGQQDTGKKHLVSNKAAKRQGKNRLERGQTVFHQAQEMARKKGWPFNWILVEVPGIGHSSKHLLQAPELYQALGLEAAEDTRTPASLRH